MGLPSRIPGIDDSVGKTVSLKGEYIDKCDAFKTNDNPDDSVLHFTHHPVGYFSFWGDRAQTLQ
jgi:hypothetical protein